MVLSVSVYFIHSDYSLYSLIPQLKKSEFFAFLLAFRVTFCGKNVSFLYKKDKYSTFIAHLETGFFGEDYISIISLLFKRSYNLAYYFTSV